MAIHNKSKRTDLRVGTQDEVAVAEWETALKAADKMPTKEGIAETDCQVMKAADGRVSVKGKKSVFGYQLVARSKFGRHGLEDVKAVKTEKDSLVISHLCGTRNCIVADHLVIERKEVNDDRTHCHFVMRNVFAKSGKDGLAKCMALGLCAHEPACGSIAKV